MAATEYQRFTIEDVNAGLGPGWEFACGWFRLDSLGTAWAWYRREATGNGKSKRPPAERARWL